MRSSFQPDQEAIMKGTEFLLHSIVADGVDRLFLVPGGLVDPFYEAIETVEGLTPIVAAQEGGAAYAADGYARASARFGACLVIGGPGLTNTATAISAAQSDGVPVLVISGEVETYVEGLGVFQDASAGTFDDSAVLGPITAQSYSVPDVRLLHHAYQGALRRMFDGQRAPVHLSVPKDAQIGEVAVAPTPLALDLIDGQPFDADAATTVFTALAPERPLRVVLLVGHELGAAGEVAKLLQFAERFHLPVATTQLGKGALPEDHDLSLGVFGYAGTGHATAALLEGPDLVVLLGSAFNQRDSMHWTARLAPRCGTVAIHTTSVPLAVHGEGVRFVHGHATAALRWLGENRLAVSCLEEGRDERRSWLASIKASTRYFDAENSSSNQVPIHPARLVVEARRACPRETIVVCDSGAHRAFVVHYWDSYGPREFITAAGLGPMGWAVPAAVGVASARRDVPVVVFTGDGCMQMHGLEVQTAARYGLRVIYVVSNNSALGNVWLRAHKLGSVPAELTTLPDHDWAGFARALGMVAETVRQPAELGAAFARALASNGPYLLDVKTEKNTPTPVEPYRRAATHWSYEE
jgi:acetolactate synthase-1/2/3 large subunit